MKYTEAVALIEETFEMQGTGVQMRTKDAACILDALIEAGMMPPIDPNEVHCLGWEPE